jgi:hypothetical protein
MNIGIVPSSKNSNNSFNAVLFFNNLDQPSLYLYSFYSSFLVSILTRRLQSGHVAYTDIVPV